MNSKGFSLLEVLIAGVILFAAISTAALVYTSATKSAIQASKSISFSAQLPLILETIKSNLRQSGSVADKNGQGNLPFGQYQWRAVAGQVKRPLPQLSVDSGQFSVPDVNIVLWSVELDVTIDNTSRQYSIFVTGWVD